MALSIYISYTAGCTGWNMDEIYKGTWFKSACRTNRFREMDAAFIKMLDWDYLAYKKKPEKTMARHLQIVKDHDIETIMSMDAWEENIELCLGYTEKLLKFADRVLIPVHTEDKRLLEFNLAYPNANWFDVNPDPHFFSDNVTHILGGSPHSQLKLYREGIFPNIESIDGNQIFNTAVNFCKTWFPKGDKWRKVRETNKEAFRLSVKHLQKQWERHIRIKQTRLSQWLKK